MKKLLLPFVLMFVLTVAANAQTPTPTPDAEFDLVERAQMVSEIKRLRVENTAKDVIIIEQRATINAYQKLNVVQEARISDLKEALAYRTAANTLDVKIENMYKEQVNEYKLENARLREENKKLAKSRDRRSLIFGLAGLAAGAFIW